MVSGQYRGVTQNPEGLATGILHRRWLRRFKLNEELRWDWRRSRSYLEGRKRNHGYIKSAWTRQKGQAVSRLGNSWVKLIPRNFKIRTRIKPPC